MLAGAGKGEKRNGGSRVRLSGVDTGRLLGLKNELVWHFELVADMVGVAY